MADPYCLAMVLCDGVYQEAITGKMTILGTFSVVGAPEFPWPAQFCIYFAVTDGQGATKLLLRLVDAKTLSTDDDDGVVLEMNLDVDFPDPLAVVEQVVVIGTTIPSAGVYHCELLSGDDLLMSRRILAIAKNPEKEKSDV